MLKLKRQRPLNLYRSRFVAIALTAPLNATLQALSMMFRSWQMGIDVDTLRQQQGRPVNRNFTVMCDVLNGKHLYMLKRTVRTSI